MRRTTESAAYSGTDNPQFDWDDGYDKSDGVTGTASRTIVNAKPTESKTFNFNYKVVKRIHLKLDPGQEQHIQHVINYNRIIDREYWTEHEKVKGLQFIWLHNLKGVAGDTANTHAVGTISTTPAKFVGTWSTTYKARAVSIFPRIVYQSNTLDTTAIGTGNLYTIADAAGNVVDNNANTNFA